MSIGKTRAWAGRGPRLLRQIVVRLLAQTGVLRHAYKEKESSAPAPKGGSSCQCQDREPSPAPAFDGLARRWPCLPALAALYVGEFLSEEDEEAYETHFMGCAECVADVELWRTIACSLRQVDETQFVTAAGVRADLDSRMGDGQLRFARRDSMRKVG